MQFVFRATEIPTRGVARRVNTRLQIVGPNHHAVDVDTNQIFELFVPHSLFLFALRWLNQIRAIKQFTNLLLLNHFAPSPP